MNYDYELRLAFALAHSATADVPARVTLKAALRCGLRFFWPYKTAPTIYKAKFMYKTAEVARAVGVSAATLASWIDRRMIDLGPSPGTGTPRTFSPDDVYRISIVSELVRLGVSVSEAAKAASTFNDDANGDRDASTLFSSGKTVLLLDADGARCVNIADRGAFEAAMETVYGDTYGVIAVNVSEIVDRAKRALAGMPVRKAPAGAVFRNGRQLMT